MKRFTLVFALIATFGLATGLGAQQAQEQEVRQELRSMVTGGDEARADRAVVEDFLERDDVKQVAAERGIDLERLDDAVRTLDPDEAATLAQHVQNAKAQLAGGDTLVITTTTIIIILLILILIEL